MNIDTVLDATVPVTKGSHQLKIRAVNDPFSATGYSLNVLGVSVSCTHAEDHAAGSRAFY